jgi:segregation and condensation protein A
MYRVKLNQFEGPLDLLLFFIRRDELDIYDIPIASIADEFLEYVRLMHEVDLDVAGDFVYFASLLVNIKARMLLPSTQVDDDGEPIDPRQELIDRLLEYVRFKEATNELVIMSDRRADLYTRGSESRIVFDSPEDATEDLVDVTVFDLMTALRRVLTEAPAEIVHEIQAEAYTLEELFSGQH